MSNDHGIAVAKPGFDVSTATGDQFAFSSKYNTFLIFDEQSLIVAGTGGTVNSTISHNLGYKPAFMAFLKSGTTDTVDGVSYSNAIFHCESEFFHPFVNSADKQAHAVLVRSDTSDVLVRTIASSGQNHDMYVYTFVDLAEETSVVPAQSGNNYGIRIAQKGYDVLTEPDYRMIYSSRYKAFTIAATGTITVNAGAVTLNDLEEDLTKVEVLFSSIGVSSGHHPFIFMAEGKDFSNNDYPTTDAYLSMTGIVGVVNSGGLLGANYNLFLTDDRIVAYIWRSFEFFGGGDPANLSYPAMSITFRYMIFGETFTIA